MQAYVCLHIVLGQAGMVVWAHVSHARAVAADAEAEARAVATAV